jgi:hypothetical protein
LVRQALGDAGPGARDVALDIDRAAFADLVIEAVASYR